MRIFYYSGLLLIKTIEKIFFQISSVFEKFFIHNLRWLYAPSLKNFGFTIRTTFAALIALYIALWMNLGNPHWAPMTVWVVAQKTRGESISKAKWRLVGTAMGAISAVSLVSAFPQQPALFIIGLGGIVGTCATLATFLKNFRSYALVLTGYSCATIALDASINPNNVFMTAMSRATYIALGIIVESTISKLFTPNLATQAHQKLTNHLQTAIREVSLALVDLLSGKEDSAQRCRILFSTILSINDQIEYSEQELSSNKHEGDHARATIAYCCFLLSRGLSMAAHIRLLDKGHKIFQVVPEKVKEFLKTLPETIKNKNNFTSLLEAIHFLRSECRQHMIDTINREVSESLAVDNPKAEYSLNERILHYVMFGLLGELEHVIIEYQATQNPIKGDNFRFKMKAHRDLKGALINGLRSFSAVFFSGIIWEVTGWSEGYIFLIFVALASGRYATYDTPHISCIRYLRGASFGFLVATFLNFVALPRPDDFVMLALCLGPAMMLGGLAARGVPKALTTATAYNMFMLFLVNPENQAKIDEISFLNEAMALLSGMAFAVLIFYLIFPRNFLEERWRLRRNLLHDLRTLATTESILPRMAWLSRNVDRLVRLIRHAPGTSSTLNAYLEGILATTALGLNIIRIREIASHNILPSYLQKRVLVVIRRIGQFTGKKHGRTARIARAAIISLRREERNEVNLTKRLEISRAIAGLTTIAYELETHEAFLDISTTFMKGSI